MYRRKLRTELGIVKQSSKIEKDISLFHKLVIVIYNNLTMYSDFITFIKVRLIISVTGIKILIGCGYETGGGIITSEFVVPRSVVTGSVSR